jgi:putative ABC transport system substrate-binding protein
MMRRRDFITLIGGAAAALPLAARAQQATAKPRRIGIVVPYEENDPEYRLHVDALRQALAKLGWTDGNKVLFDERWTTDNMDRVRSAAAALLASNPDVVVAIGGRVIPVLRDISHSVPIVVPGAADPIGIGWVQSLARPGGNITGFTFLELSLLGKMLEILKQIAPAAVRVAMIYNPDNPSTITYLRSFEASARELAVDPITIPVHGFADIERAMTGLADPRDIGVLVPPDVTLNALREEVVALLARIGVPAIYPQHVFVKRGGLVFYGVDRIELWRRAADYVDRILRGEKPGDLPFQQPTKYQLIINLKTAKALGLTIPPMLLARADEVIE